MRRKDREIPKELAYQVSDTCEWAVLSMVDTANKPYCVPISIVRNESIIYIHCAKNGVKTDALRNNSNVCISCVGYTYRMPNKFTTEYESAIIKGQAFEVEDETEKTQALKLLCLRHTPTNMHEFTNAIENSLHRTAVWKIEISEITGKRKIYNKDNKEKSERTV